MTTTTTTTIRVRDLDARIIVATSSVTLRDAIARSIQARIDAVPSPLPISSQARVVRLRTTKRVALLDEHTIAIVSVTSKNAKSLPRLVDDIRSRRVLGVQLVWDGTTPSRDVVEAFIFKTLEHARATPSMPPVVLAKTHEPTLALRYLVSSSSSSSSSKGLTPWPG